MFRSFAALELQVPSPRFAWSHFRPREKVIASVDPQIYDRYVGQYQASPDFILTVTNENGKLMMQATGQSRLELFAESETDFFLKDVVAQIKFVKDAEGKVTGLILLQNGRETPTQKIK